MALALALALNPAMPAAAAGGDGDGDDADAHKGAFDVFGAEDGVAVIDVATGLPLGSTLHGPDRRRR